MATDWFSENGYGGLRRPFVAKNPLDQKNYRIEIPSDFYNQMGEQEHVKSLGWLCRIFDWREEEYARLPLLPDELIPKIFTLPKLEKSA